MTHLKTVTLRDTIRNIITRARGASLRSLYRVSLRKTARVKALVIEWLRSGVSRLNDSHLQANIAAYIGPERKNQRTTLDCLSLNQSAVHMKARKLVTMERTKT